ncbi:UvrD-helicase domain-containing protein [Thermomonas sp.]|uniref:UvrD-helicase domain-containing protein n=1 Tax=Thermomonas sp. TaxID=1971895 RepID=UPI002634818E|nr:UvrD-helicase domain-containing protein [Thermomonas sp.]MCO5054526.1 UvrD-helicase domain-containing protein [Thermomonas sp.]
MSGASSWMTLPLDDGGRSLVEASAGTGKTWTIAALYLRLLLERELTPRRIVVSTFTNAAAAELSERLRGKLLWALAEAESMAAGGTADDESASDRQWLLQRWLGDANQCNKDVQRLQAALAEFDAAPISTLHALCARILAEHPFAAGALFRERDMIDGKTLEKSLTDDLWRVISQGSEADELVQLAHAAEIDRNKLKKYVPVLLQANVEVGPLDPQIVAAAVSEAVGGWQGWVANVREVVSAEGLLNRGGRLGKAWAALADAFETSDEAIADILEEYRRDLLDASSMRGVNKAGKTDSQVRKLVDLSPGIAAAISPLQLELAANRALRTFLSAARRWCRQAMQSRLDAANQSTFDQILVAVSDALQPHAGQRALADALFAEWPVALVDEFQDTDPVQFGILDAIYREGGAEKTPRGRLVMIGDPKQSIYRFRGGDVQTYERAKSEVPPTDRLTLNTNHRSSRGYVEAINQFYAATGRKLGDDKSTTTIAYEDVQASGRQDATPLRSAPNGEPVARLLVLHELADPPEGVDLETLALKACAGQIAWALSAQGYCIDRLSELDELTRGPLKPGDIAVLLPTNGQIRKLSALLKMRGVPCVATTPSSVFETDTARDLRLILHALLHPDDAGALRAALATRLCGLGLRKLQALDSDSAAWDRQAAKFHALRAHLVSGGPLEVVARLLEGQAPRLLEATDGERVLTDLRHLGELLQEAWLDVGGGERLAAWFADQVEGDAEGGDAADARALRLESDAARVRLLTLHGSKGLEFGVVFLPLMWKHKRPGPAGKGAQLLSDADGQHKYLVEGQAKDIVKQQEFDERCRMLYVALTRAIHACHVFTLSPEVRGAQKQSDEAPLNRLPLGQFGSGEAAPACIECRKGWEAHEGLSLSAGTDTASPRRARPLPPAPAGPLPMRHSFTTLSGGGHRPVLDEGGAAEDEELLEQDDAFQNAVLPEAPSEVPATSTAHTELEALAAVAGTEFGNAVHALFERREPHVPMSEEAVLAALREHGVRLRGIDDGQFSRDLARRLQAVLDTPLRMRASDPLGPRLWDLDGDTMRAEMEFNYLLDGATLRALRNACVLHGEPDLVPGHDQTLAGVMNGKIDLLFASGGRIHVLDYKGNRLSAAERPCLEDYAPDALDARMRDTHYRFQALLYTIATERYLRARLGDTYRRETHLGDCWYLFIRAVGLNLPDGTPCGVWHHRFNDGLLDAVQAALGLPLQEAA